MFTVQVLDHGSAEHEAALELRRRVLREPLGLPGFSAREQELEVAAVPFGCFAPAGARPCAQLVGTLLLQPLVTEGDAPRRVQMRQVAVEPEWQGRGVGRTLAAAAESWCRGNGTPTELFAHAREPAVPFYERLGYAVLGEPFLEVGILHRLVTKHVL